MRVHVSYSERHFHPEKERSERFNYTAGQTAYHLWEAIRARFPEATYGDTIPDEPLDLLWTQNALYGKGKARRIAWIQTGPHPEFQNRQIRQAMRHPAAASGAALREARELRSLADSWNQYRMVALSDAILLKGNETILGGWRTFCPPFGDKFQLFCNGVVPGRHRDLGQPRSPLSFVYPATRFSLRKGSHLVADAWRAFVRTRPDATLTLMGRHGDFDLTAQLAGIPGVVDTGPFSCGSSEQVALLNGAQFVFFPSLAEGQAGTLLEAMSCGCIPVATRESGIDAERYGGIPVAEANAPACLEALGRAIHVPAEAARQHLAAEMANRHRWEHFRAEVIEVSERLLGSGPPSPTPTWQIAWLFAKASLGRKA